MKRFLTVICMLISICSLQSFALTAYPPVSHYMIGRVDTVVEFNIEMLEEVLPFDLEGADVAYNGNYSVDISGLKVGNYSIVANRRDFTLTITHTNFRLSGGYVESDPTTFIDYRLYLVLNFDTKYFKSCLTDGSIEVKGSDTQVWPETGNDMALLLIREGLFISLDDGNGTTAASIENLKDGDYSSTISFVLTVE